MAETLEPTAPGAEQTGVPSWDVSRGQAVAGFVFFIVYLAVIGHISSLIRTAKAKEEDTGGLIGGLVAWFLLWPSFAVCLHAIGLGE